MTAESRDVEVYREAAQSTAVALWGTDNPRGMTARMTDVADAMKDAIEARGMFAVINQRKYVLAEGWSLVGAMVGVFPRPRAVDELRDAEGALVGFRATVDLVTRDGGVCGGAVALCTRDEAQWSDRDWNQIASMAQTRATAKAYRSTLGFIMPMAGYAATPAEEMDGIAPRAPRQPAPRQQQQGTDEITNVGQFLTACLHEFDLNGPKVRELHKAKDNTVLGEIAESVGGWADMLDATRNLLRDQVPA